jgi:hypothetical protein
MHPSAWKAQNEPPPRCTIAALSVGTRRGEYEGGRRESADKSMPLECLDMSGTAGEEHANLYMRGVNEAASGAELDAQEILDVLDVFGEDGVRMYLVGFLEGIKDRQEEQIEEYEMLEASVAFVVHESSVSILEESEDTMQVWIESAPKDLSTERELHIVDDEEEILQGGRIVAVEFKDAEETSENAPAIATVKKWKDEIVEYSDPEDWPRD